MKLLIKFKASKNYYKMLLPDKAVQQHMLDSQLTQFRVPYKTFYPNMVYEEEGYWWITNMQNLPAFYTRLPVGNTILMLVTRAAVCCALLWSDKRWLIFSTCRETRQCIGEELGDGEEALCHALSPYFQELFPNDC